jgi:hypothetical protein
MRVMSFLRAVVLASMAGAAGCALPPATPKPAQPPAVASDGDVQCRIERPTGSNLGVEVCTTKAQRDATRADTQQVQEELGNTQAGCARAHAC